MRIILTTATIGVWGKQLIHISITIWNEEELTLSHCKGNNADNFQHHQILAKEKTETLLHYLQPHGKFFTQQSISTAFF